MAQGNENTTRAGRAIERLDDRKPVGRKLTGIPTVESSPSDFGNKEPDYDDEIAEEEATKKIGK